MTLVAFAITVGFLFSVATTFILPGQSLYWEISTLISVFLAGHWLEMRAVRGATGALTELAKLIPKTAHLIKGGKQTDIETESLKIKDVILVKPGEKIPIDGVVLEGDSSIDESMLIGESRPVSKQKGDKVIGGSLNQDGSLTIQVLKVGASTTVSQITKLIQGAQSSKPNVQVLADRAAGYLFYIAVAVGILSFIFWLLIHPQNIIFAVTTAVAVVVVTCPHALGFAIPTVTTITSSLGAKNGILIKEMKALELARKINYVVFDKTGTLTKGQFVIEEIIQTSSREGGIENILSLASSVEQNSQHSIAQSIIKEARARKIDLQKIIDFKSYPGKGATATVNGKKVAVGNESLMKLLKLKTDKLKTRDAGTIVYVAMENKLIGALVLTDEVREESKKAIDKLHGMGIKVAMLTGDLDYVAKEVGKKLNIDTIFSQTLPEDKINKIKDLQSQGNIVAMVGDGINDAPSLTQAHVGIAIGAGTDVAVESAQIVLMKNNPLDVVKAINLSRKTNVKMLQNLAWATGYNVFAIPLAAGVLYPKFGILLKPEWAAILMSMSSIIVVFNALLLKKVKL